MSCLFSWTVPCLPGFVKSGGSNGKEATYRAFLVPQMVKNPPAIPETWAQFLGQEDPLEKDIATRSSILAWKSHGQRSRVGCSPWGHKESDTTVRLTLFTRGVIQGQSPHSYSVPFPLIPPGLQHILIQFEKRQEISLVTLYTYAALSVVCECVCVCVSVCVCTCVCIYMGVCFPQFEEGGNFPSKQRLSSLVISFY